MTFFNFLVFFKPIDYLTAVIFIGSGKKPGIGVEIQMKSRWKIVMILLTVFSFFLVLFFVAVDFSNSPLQFSESKEINSFLPKKKKEENNGLKASYARNRKAHSKEELSYEEIYHTASKAIVTVEYHVVGRGKLYSHTGFFIAENGYILTLGGEPNPYLKPYVITSDGQKLIPILIERLPRENLLLYKVKGKSFSFLSCGDATTSKVGEPVVSVSNADGTNPMITRGIVSSTSRIFKNRVFFQIDLPVNPENVAGPLLNLYGEVVGIIIPDLIYYQNLNFALPINYITFFNELPSQFDFLSKEHNAEFKKWTLCAVGILDAKELTTPERMHRIFLALKSVKDFVIPYIVFENQYGKNMRPQLSKPLEISFDAFELKNGVFVKNLEQSFQLTGEDFVLAGHSSNVSTAEDSLLYFAELPYISLSTTWPDKLKGLFSELWFTFSPKVFIARVRTKTPELVSDWEVVSIYSN